MGLGRVRLRKTQGFSSAPRYNHFDTSPNGISYIKNQQIVLYYKKSNL